MNNRTNQGRNDHLLPETQKSSQCKELLQKLKCWQAVLRWKSEFLSSAAGILGCRARICNCSEVLAPSSSPMDSQGYSRAIKIPLREQKRIWALIPRRGCCREEADLGAATSSGRESRIPALGNCSVSSRQARNSLTYRQIKEKLQTHQAEQKLKTVPLLSLFCRKGFPDDTRFPFQIRHWPQCNLSKE